MAEAAAPGTGAVIHALPGGAAVVGGRIRVLPPPVAEQIAAGEVVERPASVVKELVENAIDAGARHVVVEVTGGGVEGIVVVDDGHGMGPEDAVVAFRRHATSKIATADDLLRVTTLGFRGEALAAIAAIADLRLVTRPEGIEAGTEVRVRGGSVTDVREAGAAVGTRVEVRDLFFNTPARRKFLKAPGTESGHIAELVSRFALAYPSIGFVLRNAGRLLMDHPAVERPEERLWQVFGRERAAAMRAVANRGVAGAAHGWVTDPHLNFPTARHVYTYVNGRFVRDRLVNHALMAGYATLLMHGRYPGAVLFLAVPPEEVDVNVHPAKAEVRFRRSGLVHELIARAVGDALRAMTPPRPDKALADFGGGREPDPPPSARLPEPDMLPLRLVPMPQNAYRAGATAAAPAEFAGYGMLRGTRAEGEAAGRFSSMRVIGQAFDGYLVCQNGDALVIIDQHAAHERVMFERLRQAFSKGAVSKQALLVPAIVELRPREAALLAEADAELDRIGFEIEPFGNSAFAVRAVPALLADVDPSVLVRDLVEEVGEIGSSRRLLDAAEDVLARLACHSVVRVGQALRPEEIDALLRSMDGIDFAGNCPHGRPAFITLPRADLERRFRRT